MCRRLPTKQNSTVVRDVHIIRMMWLGKSDRCDVRIIGMET